MVAGARRLLVLVAAGSALTACSLLLLDPSAYTDGAGGGDRGDASRDDATGPRDDAGGRSDAPFVGTDGGARCPTFVQVCDDFESGGLAKWTEQTANTGQTAVVDAGGAPPSPWGGAFAFRVSGGVNPPLDGGTPKANVAFVHTAISPVLSGDVFLRFYLYLPAVLLADTSLAKLGHRSTTASPDDINIKVALSGGMDRYRINCASASRTPLAHRSSVPTSTTWRMRRRSESAANSAIQTGFSGDTARKPR